ncbi:hypothetical protein [Aquabacterium sp.]|uniref:hypothetical protein n=1 Tax=Aquabacterium sp. TaxID=1872578 RepID=UPI0025BC3605|nr:hypothetical protein [Aquabacterium sp.]
MALIKCHECGHDVSTEATACPNCGAKPKKSGVSLFHIVSGTIILGLVLLLFASKKHQSETSEATTQTTASAQAESPASEPDFKFPDPPKHRYAMRKGDEYGYERDLSQEDISKGTKATALIMVRLIQADHGSYRLVSTDGPVQTMISCEEPCEFMTVSMMLPGITNKSQTLRADPNTIGGAMLQDARNGLLELAGQAKRPAQPASSVDEQTQETDGT